MAMLSGVAMISDQWDWLQIGAGALVLCLSATTLFRIFSRWNEKLVSKALQRDGVRGLRPSSWRTLASLRRIIVDGVQNLRVRDRRLAEYQPRLDPRLTALILNLARHSQHPLSKVAEQSLAAYVKQEESITQVSHGAAGGVMAQWRGHHVMLHAPSGQYGEAQLSLCLTIDGEASAMLYFDEALRIDAAPMLRCLKQMDVECLVYDSEPAELLTSVARQLGTTIQANVTPDMRDDAMRRNAAQGSHIMALSLRDGMLTLTSCDGANGYMASRSLAAFPAAIRYVRAFCRARERSVAAILIAHVFALGLIFAGSDWRLALLAAITLSAMGNLAIHWLLEQICGREPAEKLQPQSAWAMSPAN
jgi:predicted transcriptional regulator